MKLRILAAAAVSGLLATSFAFAAPTDNVGTDNAAMAPAPNQLAAGDNIASPESAPGAQQLAQSDTSNPLQDNTLSNQTMAQNSDAQSAVPDMQTQPNNPSSTASNAANDSISADTATGDDDY